jgi:hypothetical protein
MDSDARKWTMRSNHRHPFLHLQGCLHPPLHVLQRGAEPATPADPLSQRCRFHYVHDLLCRQQRIPGVDFEQQLFVTTVYKAGPF